MTTPVFSTAVRVAPAIAIATAVHQISIALSANLHSHVSSLNSSVDIQTHTAHLHVVPTPYTRTRAGTWDSLDVAKGVVFSYPNFCAVNDCTRGS